MLTSNVLANPFKALEAYASRDRDRFFGRDGDLCLMLDRLLSSRTTLLFAGSGVGKTSFLNAKLVPELDGRYFVVRHAKWAPDAPLAAVRRSLVAALATQNGDAAAGPEADSTLLQLYRTRRPGRSLLVLDQFEELFQHHQDTPEFDAFVDALVELINAEMVDLRVLFSMREDFLGELSVFDNRIPDLFNNYYRLKNPTSRQATEIIQLTCKSVGVTCDAKGLDLFVEELQGAARRRPHVSPPFLQIACHRLWEAQFQSLLPSSIGSPFLAGFTRGGANRVLRGYCRDKLGDLSTERQDLAAEAFAYLMTKQGAKMAYELSALSEHMDVLESDLAETLDVIARPDVRILQESAGPGGARWFELYHDMYAPFLLEWRNEQLSDRRRRQDEELRRRTDKEVERRVRAAPPFARSVIQSIFTLPLAPIVLLVLLRRGGESWRTSTLSALGWLLGWVAGLLTALPAGLIFLRFHLPEWSAPVTLAILLLLSGPAGAVLAFWKIAPRAKSFGRGSVVEYFLLSVAAIAVNCRLQLGDQFWLDLSPVTPLFVTLVAYRFGPVSAAVCGTVTASIAILIASIVREDIWSALLYQGAHFGPWQMPHSILHDAVSLMVLGAASGWFFGKLRHYVARRGVDWAEIIGPTLTPATRPVRRILGTLAAVILLLAADLVYRIPPGLLGKSTFLPPRNLVILVAILVGYRLGPQRGALATALAMLTAWMAGVFVQREWFFFFDYNQAGHVVSLAVASYWGGLAARLAQTRTLVDLTHSASAGGFRAIVLAVWALTVLLAASVYFTVDLEQARLRIGLEPLIGVTAAMLLGVSIRGSLAACVAGVAALSMNFFLRPRFSEMLQPSALSLVGIEVNLGSWSSLGIATLVGVSWLAARLDVGSHAERRRWLAIVAFAFLELPSLLEFGVFPSAYVTGRLLGWDVSIVTGPLRILEPLLVAYTVDLVARRFIGRPQVQTQLSRASPE